MRRSHHHPSILPPGVSLEDLNEEEEEEVVDVVVREGFGALESRASNSLRRALASSSVSYVCVRWR